MPLLYTAIVIFHITCMAQCVPSCDSIYLNRNEEGVVRGLGQSGLQPRGPGSISAPGKIREGATGT